MPLQGNDKTAHKIFFFISILTLLSSVNAFSQTKNFAVQEEKLAEQYSKMASFFYEDRDSLQFYSKKFEKDFKRFIKSNPGTMQYDFKKLSEGENICQVHTSSDGNLRIYNWDTENAGPVHYYKSIYQWRSNGKVFTNITDSDEDVDGGDVCANLYTVMIDKKAYYLVIKNSEGSARDHGESISAYCIDGEKLNDTVKLFKTRTETLNSIIVNIDNLNVVDDYNQDEGITYDAQRKIVSIPLVNENNARTNNYLLYKLKGRYFEYIGTNTFYQRKNLAAQEEELTKLYAKMESFLHASYDSLIPYSEKFDKELTRFISDNPGTLNYPFKKFTDNNVCDVNTSSDGNFRIYTWDTQTGGTMHFYHEILQWNANGKVFTKITKYEEGEAGSFCSAIYTAQVNNKPVYLAIKDGTYSTKDAMQAVTAFRINGNLLDSVKLFKTKTERLNTIAVYYDFFSVVDRPDRPLKLISYNDILKQLYIPLVGDKDQVTKENLVYQLKDHYFEYTGVGPDRRHVWFEDVKTKFQSKVTNQCDTIRTHLNDNATRERIAFLNKDFSTDLFSRNNSVAYWYCNAYDNNNKRIHFEIVSMLFKTEKDRDAALQKIKSTGRTNLKVKLLTMFKVKTFDKELIIAYSETSKHKVLAPFWDKLFE
jgi:hypothetical protein